MAISAFSGSLPYCVGMIFSTLPGNVTAGFFFRIADLPDETWDAVAAKGELAKRLRAHSAQLRWSRTLIGFRLMRNADAGSAHFGRNDTPSHVKFLHRRARNVLCSMKTAPPRETPPGSHEPCDSA